MMQTDQTKATGAVMSFHWLETETAFSLVALSFQNLDQVGDRLLGFR